MSYGTSELVLEDQADRATHSQPVTHTEGCPAPVSCSSPGGARNKLEMRGKIMALESAMLAMPERHIEIKTTHHFAPGVYLREIFIPKGATVVGKIHKTEHMNVMSQGKMMVWTDEGMKTLSASTVIKSQPGIKRVGHALEDSVWITVHPTTETDLEKIEDLLIAKTFDEVLGFTERKEIEEK